MNMFCYQCEQTAKGEACVASGVCSKDPETAALQDLLLHVAKEISIFAHKAGELGVRDIGVDRFISKVLFTTVTNVNFDPDSLVRCIEEGAEELEVARTLYEEARAKAEKAPEQLGARAAWTPAASLEGLLAQAGQVSIATRKQALGDDITGLQELIVYGAKGAGAYAYHAALLGQADAELYAFLHEALSFVASEPTDADELLAMALRVGEANLRAMELLDTANTGAYGDPEPTQVRIEPVKGKCILVSGHTLKDLQELLQQTEGKDINVYTHGEMLPANAYPGLKKYEHLVGNFGGPWQVQQREFDTFPGAILMTTNCIMRPRDSYKGRLFTSGPVGWPGVVHIDDGDFTPVIEAALAAEGFEEDGPDRTILVGFGHRAVMDAAGAVIDAVKSGKIRHFFLIGGCDGARPGRSYYTELAEAVPKDCIILTLACGKYRFNKLDFGDIDGIPRLLDVGQCNDAYSAVQIALSLAGAFDCGVNDLPLSLILSWYEQKAVAILLTLLHLGIKDIRLGPSLPAFITPTMLNVLVDTFNIMPISTPREDLQAILSPSD
jgi:hydroxylamine reductase